MKKIALILCLLTAGAIISQNTPPPLVEVTGQGIVKVQPDQVAFRVGVEYTGNEPAELKRQTDQVISQVLGLLKAQGVEKEQIQTSYVQLEKQYDYQTKKQKYFARQQIAIVLKDLKKYDGVMNGLITSGINRIESLSFGSSRMEELRAQARTRAVNDARIKATEYATALGQSIGRATYIREFQRSESPQPVLRTAMVMDDTGAANGTTLAPGEIEVRVVVYVGFELK